MSARHTALALLVILIWGLNFVVVHEGLQGVPPLLFVAIRFTVLLAALPFVPRPKVPWRDLAAVGLLMSAGQFGLLYAGMAAGVASGLASLVLQAQALFTMVIAAVVLREKPKAVQIVGMVIALVGLVVVAGGRTAGAPLGGLGLCLAAAASWGAGNVAARRLAGASGLGITVWSGIFVPVPLYLLSLLLDGPHTVATALAHFSLASVLSTLYTVTLASLVGYTIWNGLLGLYPAASVAPLTMLVPVVGLLSGWLFLGERPGLNVLGGGVLLLIGVACVVLGPRLMARRRTAASLA